MLTTLICVIFSQSEDTIDTADTSLAPPTLPTDINIIASDAKSNFVSNVYPGPNDPPNPPGLAKCVTAGTKYEVPAGYFQQLENTTAVKCTAGYYCPANSFQPFYCCPGYYCKSPDQIAVCPEDRYCPMGSTDPERLHCWFLANCPPGTSKIFRYGMITIIFICVVLIFLVFSIKKRMDIQRAINNRMLVEQAIDEKKQKATGFKMHSINQKTFDIEFDDLEFRLPDGQAIMHGVSGFFKSGKMTAVMGPSGAGKSTLFALLNGKIQKSKGTILLNNKNEDLSKYKKLIGYVPQDDIMHRELTVNNILLHSASMRLPAASTKNQIKRKVVQTIEFLGLGQVINTVVGDEETRGISGGQRKRVNIGMEIVADPSVLFLDEPTSGLDSSTSLELCEILKCLAKENRMTIAAVVHSPSPQSFAQFDDVLFLGKGGKMVYFGPTHAVKHYFRELGFDCPADINPADFAMDVISGRKLSNYDKNFRPCDLFQYWNSYQDGTPLEKIGRSSVLGVRSPNTENSFASKVWSSLYTITHDIYSWFVDVAKEFIEFVVSCARTVTRIGDPVRETPNWFVSYWLLLRRAFFQQFRSSKRFIFDSIIHFIAGFIVSVAVKEFRYLGREPQEVCQVAPFQLRRACNAPLDTLNQAGALMCVGILFAGQATAAYTFGNEKVVYWRDTAAGMSTTAYFLAKFTADIPRIIIASFFYTLAFTIFLDYRSAFFSLMAVNMFLYIVAFQLGYCISILFEKSSVGLLVAASALTFGFLLAGTSPKIEDVNKSGQYDNVRWLWETSAPRWGVEAYYILEAGNRDWVELKTEKWAHSYNINNYGTAIGNVFKIAIVWSIFAYMALKLTNRKKQK